MPSTAPVIAILWLGDAHALIAGGSSSAEALQALQAANPGLTPSELGRVDFVVTDLGTGGCWSAEIDGN